MIFISSIGTVIHAGTHVFDVALKPYGTDECTLELVVHGDRFARAYVLYRGDPTKAVQAQRKMITELTCSTTRFVSFEEFYE